MMGVPQIEQDGGLFSLGVTGSNVDQQCRTELCAPKYARDSFNLTTSMDSRFCSILCRERGGGRVWPLEVQMAE